PAARRIRPARPGAGRIEDRLVHSAAERPRLHRTLRRPGDRTRPRPGDRREQLRRHPVHRHLHCRGPDEGDPRRRPCVLLVRDGGVGRIGVPGSVGRRFASGVIEGSPRRGRDQSRGGGPSGPTGCRRVARARAAAAEMAQSGGSTTIAPGWASAARDVASKVARPPKTPLPTPRVKPKPRARSSAAKAWDRYAGRTNADNATPMARLATVKNVEPAPANTRGKVTG